MSNKREFKKSVEAVGAALIDEFMIAYCNMEGIDKERVQKAVMLILGATAEAKNNANVFFDKGRSSFEDAREYSRAKHQFFTALFNKITDDFNAAVSESLKEFNAAVPESVRKQNQEAAKG